MSLFLTFHGAAQTVTGSCFLLESGGSRVLVDCGMFQGAKTERELNYRAFPFQPSELTAVILSHAHIDHSGLLPKLAKGGYRGPIYATPATADLCGVMLPDSGYIQETEVAQLNKRNLRRGRPAVEPIYTARDAQKTVDQFEPVPYSTWFEPAAGIRARFWNAGHLLGSTSIEVEARDGERTVRILFSADIGPAYKLLEPDPEAPTSLDYVLCESTYGARDRAEATEEARRKLLASEVEAAYREEGVILIPSFAVERTQELVSDLVRLMDEGNLPPIPIHIDSPLATKASRIFLKHTAELDHGPQLAHAMRSPLVRFTESVEESKALDHIRKFHIVIAASGMCEAGRIRHRLRNWLWREEATVILAGFQAQGTLGRVLAEGASAVRMNGDEIQVRARIRQIDLYSGHADGPELAAWVKERLPIRHNVFLIHGEAEGMNGLKARLAEAVPGVPVLIPTLDARFQLTAEGAREVSAATPQRLQPAALGRPDWHNEWSDLVLDIQDRLGTAADDRSRGVLIRKLKRVLEEEKA
jgi:metallo-beta-lactamase family protein